MITMYVRKRKQSHAMITPIQPNIRTHYFNTQHLQFRFNTHVLEVSVLYAKPSWAIGHYHEVSRHL